MIKIPAVVICDGKGFQSCPDSRREMIEAEWVVDNNNDPDDPRRPPTLNYNLPEGWSTDGIGRTTCPSCSGAEEFPPTSPIDIDDDEEEEMKPSPFLESVLRKLGTLCEGRHATRQELAEAMDCAPVRAAEWLATLVSLGLVTVNRARPLRPAYYPTKEGWEIIKRPT